MKVLILCVETNKKANTDFVYIDRTIREYYIIDNEVKLQYEYLNSKRRYNSGKILKKINDTKKLVGKDNVFVVYFIDLDDYDISKEDSKLNDEIRKYCLKNNYEFVWFCKNVEEVFLGKSIPDSDKVKESKKFNRNRSLGFATEVKLRSSKFSRYTSNVLSVLDRLLIRKHNKK